MKRTLATLLVLIMLLTLCAACQKTDTTPGDTTANTPATTTDTPADTTDTPSDTNDSTGDTTDDATANVPDQYKSVADVWSGITLSESPYGYNYDLNYNGRTDKTDKYLHGAGSWPICDWGEKEISLWLATSDNVLK